jgi:hypothetical protein
MAFDSFDKSAVEGYVRQSLTASVLHQGSRITYRLPDGEPMQRTVPDLPVELAHRFAPARARSAVIGSVSLIHRCQPD